MITPVPYIGTGGQAQTSLGHYGVGTLSGAIAATPAALDVHASIRWAPTLTGALLVLTRLKVGWGCISAIAAAVRMAYQATIVRQFTSDYATATTKINMATVAKTQTMRSGFMTNSLMGANGPATCTTAPETVFTGTLDTAPFAMTNWNAFANTNSVGTVTIVNPGSAGDMKPLYEWVGQGMHPPVLGTNEGVIVQLVHTGWASGTVGLYAEWDWAEALLF